MDTLKKIAMAKMDEIWSTREMYENKVYDLAEKKVDISQGKLEQALSGNEEFERLASEFGDAYLDYAAVVGEDNFIRGFMEGIKFITQFQEEMKDIKKEQSAATDRSHVQIS